MTSENRFCGIAAAALILGSGAWFAWSNESEPQPANKSADRGSDDQQSQGRIEVRVLDHRLEVIPDAKVRIGRGSGEGPRGNELVFDKAIGSYRGTAPRGSLTLVVSHSRLEGQERSIEVRPGATREIAILGEKGMPFYYRGTVKVPFEPRPEFVALSVRRNAGKGDIERLEALVLEAREVPPAAKSGLMRLYKFSAGRNERERDAVVRALLQLRAVEFAGPLVSLRDRSMSFMTGELIVKFNQQVTVEQAHQTFDRVGLEVLRAVPYSANTFHVRSPNPPNYRLLDTATALAALPIVEWAEPNLVTSAEPDDITPTDFLWPGVWDRHLINTPGAWQHLSDAGLQPYGEPGIIIAAVDQGIESTAGVPDHPEFQGTVSDGSTKVYQLYDFVSLVPNNDSPLGDHGMGVSGVAAAKADNAAVVAGEVEGLAGAAPNCRIMGLIYPAAETDIADMYIWAAGFDPDSIRAGFPAPISPGADIFTTSIGFGSGAPISGLASEMLDYLMTYGRSGKGCLCFFSSGNADTEFTVYRPWAAYEKSFGMAASTLDDDGTTELRASYSDYGPVALCAPSHDEYVGGSIIHDPPTNYGTWSCDRPGAGNLIGHEAVSTTLSAAAAAGATSITLASVTGLATGDWLLIDEPGADGGEPTQITGAPDPATGVVPVASLMNSHSSGTVVSSDSNNYRNDFGGTSSATPLAAGAAALVLSANPDLSWIEARQILRDTAEKIDATNTDPIGQWLDAGGTPSVTSGLPPVYSQWYGYGRIDVEAAVAEAIAYTATRDLVGRDNLSDTGTVPFSGTFWNSPDIWVRNTDPTVEGAAALPASYSAAGPHLNPIAGTDNWVYARVKNNGTDPSLDFYVRIYITHYPGFEFTYADSFIPTNRPGDPVPSPMTPGTYLIGEVAATALGAGADTIVSVLWPADLVPPETVSVGGTDVDWHPCLLVEVSPHDGPAPTGVNVWDNNNLSQKNISITYPDDTDSDFAMGAVMGSPTNDADFLILEVDRGSLPREVRLYVDLVNPVLSARLRRQGGTTEEPCKHATAGCKCCCGPLVDHSNAAPAKPSRVGYTFGKHDGRDVLFINGRGRVRIPVLVPAATQPPIVVGGVVGQGAAKGTYQVSLIQRDPGGRVSGGNALEVVIK
jgi:hypothetical protein